MDMKLMSYGGRVVFTSLAPSPTPGNLKLEQRWWRLCYFEAGVETNVLARDPKMEIVLSFILIILFINIYIFNDANLL